MKYILFLILLLPACGESFSNAPFEADGDYLAAAPRAAQIRLGGPAAELMGINLIVAEPAEFYVSTRQTMGLLNGIAFRVLHDVDRLLDAPPTTRESDLRIWQPEGHPLDPLDHKFEMRRVDDGFEYTLKQRRRGGEGPYQATLLGRVDRDAKRGELTLDFNASATLSGGHPTGTLQVSYLFDQGSTRLELIFDQVDYGEGPFDAVYRFERAPDGSGFFDYGGSSEELDWADVRARWTADGAGRADLRVFKDDFEGTLSECWDTDFASIFRQQADQKTGDESECAFAEASYPESTQVNLDDE